MFFPSRENNLKKFQMLTKLLLTCCQSCQFRSFYFHCYLALNIYISVIQNDSIALHYSLNTLNYANPLSPQNIGCFNLLDCKIQNRFLRVFIDKDIQKCK